MTYTEGRQPCERYDPARADILAGVNLPNVHECFGPYGESGKIPGGSCSGSVSWCIGCRSDHHSDGWDTCGVEAP